MLLLHICQHRVVTFVTFSMYLFSLFIWWNEQGVPYQNLFLMSEVLTGYNLTPLMDGECSHSTERLFVSEVNYLLDKSCNRDLNTVLCCITGIENSGVIM